MIISGKTEEKSIKLITLLVLISLFFILMNNAAVQMTDDINSHFSPNEPNLKGVNVGNNLLQCEMKLR